jgi:hypothetical protein
VRNVRKLEFEEKCSKLFFKLKMSVVESLGNRKV